MKNLQINESSIGAQEYNLVELVGSNINVFPKELYKAIDLGLPSGTLWANCNIGATNEKEVGLYFQWGDIQGYTAEQVGNGEGQKAFTDNDYKFSIDGSSTKFYKYNESDKKLVLDQEDDAAHVIMGGNWRMPTKEDFSELFQNTDIYLVLNEGEEIKGTITPGYNGDTLINWNSEVQGTVKGVKFYKKNDKQTQMFAPASGYAYDGSVQGFNDFNGLWSSSLYSYGDYSAQSFLFGTSSDVPSGNEPSGRSCGLPARGILKNS